jgi:uncharacterized protein (DUF302 family)
METTTEAFVSASHARVVHLAEVPLAEVRFRLRQALGLQGFAVLSEIDLADHLNRSLDQQRAPYVVFEVSHPKLAEEALAVTLEGGIVLPCRICLWQEGRDIVVATLPASRVVEALGYPHLIAVAREIEARLEHAFDRLSEPGPAARDIPEPVPQAATIQGLNADELAVLRDAAQQQMRALLVEGAGTESRVLQHAIAKNIDELEAVSRKLGGGTPSA